MDPRPNLQHVTRQLEWRVERLHDAGCHGADLETELAVLDADADQPGIRERVTGAFLAQVWTSIAGLLRAEMTAQV